MIKTQSHSPLTGQPTIQYCLRCAQPEVQHQVISECQGELCWRHESELKSSISRETDFFLFWEATLKNFERQVSEAVMCVNLKFPLISTSFYWLQKDTQGGETFVTSTGNSKENEKKKKHVLSLQVLISTKEGGWCHYPLERNIWCS